MTAFYPDGCLRSAWWVAKQGLTLTADLKREFEREVARPLPQEVFERTRSGPQWSWRSRWLR